MKNYRAVIRDTLKSVQSDIPYDIKMADLWFMTLPDLLELTEKVDEALTSLGLIRQFASSDALLHDPSGYLRKSLRYGRRVDTRTNRLID